jgi:hypothetical protein
MCRVLDLHPFHADPYPWFSIQMQIRIRIQGLIFESEKTKTKFVVHLPYMFPNMKKIEYFVQKGSVLSIKKVKCFFVF